MWVSVWTVCVWHVFSWAPLSDTLVSIAVLKWIAMCLASEYLQLLCFQRLNVVEHLEQVHVLRMMPYKVERLVNVPVNNTIYQQSPAN